MKPQEYLKYKLENCSRYQLTEDDKKFLNRFGVEEFIYQKLTSKKFRKWAIDPDSQKRIRDSVKLNVSKNQPIQFTFPFGGYKLWRFPTSPEVDWAEFFSIAYYSNYIAPISQVYKPGAAFYFSSDDIIIERLDNIPVEDTQAYFDSFDKLLGYFRNYFPKNLSMEIRRVADLYPDKSEFEADLKHKLDETKTAFEKVDKEKKKSKFTMSELNITWKGAKDLTSWPNSKKREMIEMGPIMHDAYCSVPRRRAFVRGEDKIVVFSTVIPNAVAIGTTKTSVTKFWTGIGVLEKTASGFDDRILSPKQYEEVKNLKCEVVEIDMFDSNNFQSILIYPKFNFNK